MSVPTKQKKKIKKRYEGDNELRKGKPILVIDNGYGYVDLTHPRRDFKYDSSDYGSGNYFCTNYEYARHIDKWRPGPFQTTWPCIVSPAALRRFRPINRRPEPGAKNFEPIAECPLSSPWILNMAYFKCGRELIKLVWGPNYADPIRGVYVEISVGDWLIWTNSPYMHKEKKKRIENERRYVIENQRQPLRTVHREIEVYTGDYDRKKRLPLTAEGLLLRVFQGGWFPHDRSVCLTELRTQRDQPLYAEMIQMRDAASAAKVVNGEKIMTPYLAAREGLKVDTSNRYTRHKEGPLPQPDMLLLTSWKWVWRGLDPEISKYPSPLYLKLLRDRVTVDSEGRIQAPEPFQVKTIRSQLRRPQVWKRIRHYRKKRC